MHLIESDFWRLWSEPESGVQWAAGQVFSNGRWLDVLPDCRANNTSDKPAPGQSADAPLAAANFHMIPYSNRIRNGNFTFNDQTIQLNAGSAHAIHGALRKLPWKVLHTDNSSLVCEFDSSTHSAINWPWPMQARIEQSVTGHTLSSQISITNNGDTAMPVGAGWHPYFVRQPGNDMPVLTLPVDAVFPDSNGDCLPDGPAIELPDALDFRLPRKLDADQRIDCCMSGLSGGCRIHWPDVGIELLMKASDNCRFLVLFNPDMPHFAVEPVSNANDAFNLHSQGVDAGLSVLDPQLTFTVSMQIQAVIHES